MKSETEETAPDWWIRTKAIFDAARDEMELSGYSSREATDEQLEEWTQRLERQAKLGAYDGGVF